MQTEIFNADVPSSDVDLLELWFALLKGKWIVLVTTIAFSLSTVGYVLTLPNIYTSSALLAPVDASGGGLVSMAGQLGGLASLAGINLNREGSSKTAEAIQIMKSWAFVESFVAEHGIEPQVYAANGWDKETNKLKYNLDIFDPESGKWLSESMNDGPSSWKLYQRFSSFMRIREDQKTGFTTLLVEFYSPELAKEWAAAIVDKINKVIRERDALEAQKNIDFLKKRIEMTPLANMQNVFYSLIEDQTKSLMLASGTEEYVFRVVSEPRVAEVKSKPKRALICILGAVVGAVLGVILGLAYGIRNRT